MNSFKDKIIPIIDICMAPLTLLSTLWLRIVRSANMRRMRFSRKIFQVIGLLPIRDHYFEPLFNPKQLRHSLRKPRVLPGIDFNIREQLEILKRFTFNDELAAFPLEKRGDLEFYYQNQSFGPCEAQYLYNIIRSFKPRKIIEIGSGNSTLMALNAIKANKRQVPGYGCKQICVEPYENAWLKKLDIELIQKPVEKIDKDIFLSLDANDILFIDSSHIIRPQGDVIVEYLEILPLLKPGALIHVHDIFTPRDYLYDWRFKELKLWDEQYLLEAFLSFNKDYKIIASINYLVHDYFSEISSVCPILKSQPHQEPCSFWMMRR